MTLTNTRKDKEKVSPAPAGPTLDLPCGCRVEPFNHHGIRVTYCRRHAGIHYSPRPGTGQDVVYFVTQENTP
jgi:hypothetical protein